MPYKRVDERAIRILSRRTGISTIHKSRRKRLITVPRTWEDKSSFRNVHQSLVHQRIHQPKKRVPKEQNGPGPKDFLYPIMQLVVTASGQVSSRLGFQGTLIEGLVLYYMVPYPLPELYM